jgi:hypothetical protein
MQTVQSMAMPARCGGRRLGSYKRRRWNLSFTAGGMTYPSAQSAAMERCNTDERTQGRCQPRATACADGR